MNGQKHIIHREVLELTVPGRERALPIQNKASEIVKNKLNPALNALFSGISNLDEIVRLDKLEIDLGNIQLASFDDEIVHRAVKKAEVEIRKLINIGKTKNDDFNRQTGSKQEKIPVKILSVQEDYFDRFILFLKTGNLSWWNSTDVTNSLTEIFEKVLAFGESILKARLLPLFKNAQIRKRLVLQFDDRQLEKLFIGIDGAGFEEFSELFHSSVPFLKKFKVKEKQLKRAFWDTTAKWISENNPLNSDSAKVDFLEAILKSALQTETPQKQEVFLISVLHSFTKETNQSKSPPPLMAAVFSLALDLEVNPKKIKLTALFPGMEKYHPYLSFIKKMKTTQDIRKNISKKNAKKAGREVDKITEVDAEKPNRPAKGKQVTEIKTDSDNPFQTNAEINELVVSNAGLVLLHPLLKYFFDGLGLLDKKLQFKSPDHAIKAVHLLQYAATKNRVFPEHELALNKILCGIDLAEPIPKEMDLTAEEITECDNLLATVLERWPALKTKRTDTLRDTYLKREGILSFKNQGWNLRIERNTFDVMLDKLPWGISIISLPWNTQILYVEW